MPRSKWSVEEKLQIAMAGPRGTSPSPNCVESIGDNLLRAVLFLAILFLLP